MPGGHQIGQVITANTIPDPQASLDLLKKLDEEESIPMPRLMMAERLEKLLETLEQNGGLDSLKDWSLELAMRAR